MQSAIVKRSIIVGKHKTSVSIENPFWSALKEIGASQKSTLSSLITSIDAARSHGNLSSAIRLFVFDHFRTQPLGNSASHIGTRAEMGSTGQIGLQIQRVNGRAHENLRSFQPHGDPREAGALLLSPRTTPGDGFLERAAGNIKR